jgi:Flp pilus assembly protein TadG
MNEKRSQDGQSALEFALILPLLFFMVTAIFDLGRAVFASSTINNAAREGTRFATIQNKNGATLQTTGVTTTVCQTSSSDIALVTNVKNKVCSYVYNIKDLTQNTTIEVFYSGTSGTNPTVTVHMIYKFKPITPGMAAILGKGKYLTINSLSTMYLQAIAK